MVELPAIAIQKFEKWNHDPFKQMECYDEKMVHAVLFYCVSVMQMPQGIFDDAVYNFIKGIVC